MISEKDQLTYARGLVATEGDECGMRTKIGRLYYAAFHICSDAADRCCGPLPPDAAENKGRHERLYTRIERHVKVLAHERYLRNMAEHAKKLRNLRVTADYHLNDTVSLAEVGRSQSLVFYIERDRDELSKIMQSLASQGPSAPPAA